jgi:hypothetical protein
MQNIQPQLEAGVITPAMLNAAVTSTPVDIKKEKKRKQKDTNNVFATPVVADSEKKVRSNVPTAEYHMLTCI